MSSITLDIALAGNPNSGKTTLFNKLTGARQHVGNYPGVTVEKKEGRLCHKSRNLTVTDLPGTYSLTAFTEEEVVARDFLINTRPRVINITDASNLERNLYLTVQLLELGVSVIIALNMIDVAKQRGIQIDASRLAERLGVPVVPIIARSGQGSFELLEEAIKDAERYHRPCLELSYGKEIDASLEAMEKIITEAQLLTEAYPARWLGLKYLENDQLIIARSTSINSQASDLLQQIVTRLKKHLLTTLATDPEAVIADYRYGYIKSLLQDNIVTHQYDQGRLYISDKIDAVLTHRIVGPIIMLAILFGLYTFTFTYSELPVGWFESFFGWLSEATSATLPDGHVKSLVVSGIIDGVGGVLGFVPIIAFMFFGIAVLEDSGYLARVAYMMDRILRVFGLHGSSVMSYIVSGGIAGGCAVPGVMAARTLRSRNERLATILTAPFMNCGAKLPVLALLIAAFFQDNQSRMMFALTLVAWLGAVLVAKFLRVTIIKGESTPFVMELPPYRMPTLQGLLIHTWERTWQYIKKAGTVILAISVVIWAMMTFPELPSQQKQSFENQRQDLFTASSSGRDESAAAEAGKELSVSTAQGREALMVIDNKESETALKYSFAGRIGTALEGVSKYAGFDWRTNIALVGGFAAKEIIVSTLGTAYSLGNVDAEDTTSLSETLAAEPGWNKITGLAVILFVMFYAPCFVTVVCIARESGSWKWAVFSMAFNTTLAFFLAVTVYQVGMMIYGV